MEEVYVLQHSHDYEDGHADVKFVGVFKTPLDAENVVIQLKGKPGFRDSPNGFSIDKYEVGKVHWTDGFVTAFPDGTFSD